MSHIPKILLSCGLSACAAAVVVPSAYAFPAMGDTAQIVLVGSDQTTFYPSAGSSVKQYLQRMGVDYRLYKNTGSDILAPHEVRILYRDSAPSLTTRKVPLVRKTTTLSTDSLKKGDKKVAVVGRDGEAIQTTRVKNGQVSSSVSVLKAPVNTVIKVGTHVDSPPVSSTPIQNPNPSDVIPSPVQTVDPLVKTLYEQVGKPYVWSHEGPNDFDCSGLVYWVFNQNGYHIPRLTAEGYGAMAHRIAVADMKPGDIMYSSSHIVTYVGNGRVVHAANPREGVIESSVEGQLRQGLVPARFSFVNNK